jgi:lysophospholipase L1-like esterase
VKRKALTVLVILSLSLNLIGIVGSIIALQKKGGLPWLTRKLTEITSAKKGSVTRGDYPSNRISVFAELPTEPTDIIFLGDSILDFGEWHEFMNDHRAKNRAINGDDTGTILTRLGSIVVGHPRHIVLLCGINNFQKRIPFTKTTTEYSQIVKTISSKSPGTDLWLLSVLPVNSILYRKWIVPDHPGINMPPRDQVVALNAFIKELTVGNPRLHFVELPNLLGSTGELQETYTLDGLHLNGLGLKMIAERLKDIGIKRQPN